MGLRPVYRQEPEDKEAYTASNDRMYTLFAGVYDFWVKVFPTWKKWLKQALPHIHGPKVLEASFGTGYLLTQYADQVETYGIDYNEKMVAVASKALRKKGMHAQLQQADIEQLPFADGMFDCVVNTMAFSGYPDAEQAMSEIHRVLKPGGRLVLIDVNYPADGNFMGANLTRLWAVLGDIIRDMEPLFRRFHFDYTDEEIGCFGSVHLYVAEKKG